MSKFSFGTINQVASGAGAVNQIGENQATTNANSSADTLTVEQVFAAVVAAVESPAKPSEPNQPAADPPPAIEPATTPTPDAPVQSSPVAEDTVAPLQALACMPLASQAAPDAQAKAANLIERLVPYAPQIGKALAVFGDAALSSLANRNPIVAGLCAVCKDARGRSVA